MKPVVVEYLNASGIMGREVSLTCKASGDPLPEVTFLKEGTLIPYTIGVQNSDDRIIVDTSREGEYAQARLVIRDLMRSDDGLYACIAKNNGTFCPLLRSIPRPPIFFWGVLTLNRARSLGELIFPRGLIIYFTFFKPHGWKNIRWKLHEKWAHNGRIPAIVRPDADARGLVMGQSLGQFDLPR